MRTLFFPPPAAAAQRQLRVRNPEATQARRRGRIWADKTQREVCGWPAPSTFGTGSQRSGRTWTPSTSHPWSIVSIWGDEAPGGGRGVGARLWKGEGRVGQRAGSRGGSRCGRALQPPRLSL